jgi:hypothetical protein
LTQPGLIPRRDFLQTGGWNDRNYVLEAQQRGGYPADPSVAITEAFAWVRARGLIAHESDR